jgi:hypothetical protein
MNKTLFIIFVLIGITFSQIPSNYEFGGNVVFSYTFTSSNSYFTLLDVEPTYLKYFSSFFVGPVIGLQVDWVRSNDVNRTYFGNDDQYLLGAQAGYILDKWNPNLFPYISLGACAVLTNNPSTGISVPIIIGLKSTIGTSSIINYGIIYDFTDMKSVKSNTLGFNVGISIYK